MTYKEVSMRDAFGRALLALAERVPELVVLDADVSSSTRTQPFGQVHPDRFYNVGVAEANMVDMAAGMATCGLRPVVSSFSLFLVLKGLDQIRSVVAYNNLPVVLVGGYGGMSGSFEGASHHAIEDISAVRAIPNLSVVVPGDATEVAAALEDALHRGGPTFIRIGRNPSPALFESAPRLEYPKARSLRHGCDVSIAVCGIPTAMAIAAAEELDRVGVSADVLQISTLKPLDVDALAASVARTGAIVTVEEHNIQGGLGACVAEALGRRCPAWMDFVGVSDCFTESGPYAELLARFGISTQEIVSKCLRLIERKGQSIGSISVGRRAASVRAPEEGIRG